MFSEVSVDPNAGLVADRRLQGKRGPGVGITAAIFTVCLTVILVFLYMPELTRQQHYFMSDHCYYFQPFTRYISERLRNGELPLWNPYLYCGMSQIAVPSPGVLYLPTWLFALFDYSQGIAVNMVLHQAVAGLGAFLLVASFGWGIGPAAVCALGFSMCGYMFSLVTNYTLAADAAWLPLLLWSNRAIVQASQASQKSKVYWLTVVAGVSLYLLVACGRPEISIPGSALVGLWIVAHLKAATKCGALKWQIAAVAMGALLCAPVLLPVVEWVKLSPRSTGLNLSQVLMWSTNWYDWLCLIAVRPLGDLQILGASMLKLVATRSLFLPYISSNYVGPVVVTLAIWGVTDKTWRWRWAVGALIAGSVIMCVGEYWPIAPWLVTHIPFLAVFRYPIKWIIFPILFMAICAARGVYSLERLEIGRFSVILTWLGWTIGTAVAAVMLWIASEQRYWIVGKLRLYPAAERAIAYPLLWACGIGFAICLLQWLAYKKKISTRNASAAVVLATAATLIVCAATTAQMTVPYDFFAHKQELALEWQKLSRQFPGTTRLGALLFDPLCVPGMYRDRPKTTLTPSFYQYGREVLLPNMNIPAHVPMTFGYEAAETKFFRQLYFDAIHKSNIALQIRSDGKLDDVTGDLPLYRMYQATGTQFVSSQKYKGAWPVHVLDQQYFSKEYENQTMNARIYRVKDPMPRAYFTQYWDWIDKQSDVADDVLDAYNSGFDPACDLYVNRTETSGAASSSRVDPFAPQLPLPPNTPPVEPNEFDVAPTAVYPVTITVDKPEHVSLSVKTAAPGFVVLTDHFYPGWQALVDGVPRPIYKANLESRAVYIPKGAHLIEFNFEPESLKIGFLLCALGCTFAVLLLVCALAPMTWSAIKRTAGQ
jgi:hypothetical protein